MNFSALLKCAAGVGGAYLMYDMYQAKNFQDSKQKLAAAAVFIGAALVAVHGARSAIYGGY